MWRGEPLCGATGPFIDASRAYLTDLRFDGYILLAELECALGHHVAAAQDLTPIVRAYPLCEDLRGKLMLALHLSGRQAEARAEARDLRAALAEDQGLSPGRTFTDLEHAILQTNPELDLADPKPIRQPRRVQRPILVPAQLPLATSDFTGRYEHIRQLDAFVPPPPARPADQAHNIAVLVKHPQRRDRTSTEMTHGGSPEPTTNARAAVARRRDSPGARSQRLCRSLSAQPALHRPVR